MHATHTRQRLPIWQAHVEFVTEEHPGGDPNYTGFVSPSGAGYVNDCCAEEFLFAMTSLAQAKMEALHWDAGERRGKGGGESHFKIDSHTSSHVFCKQ